MENRLISKETEQQMISDLKKLVDNKMSGEISLSDYMNVNDAGACMDFAMIYESADDLQRFIKNEIQKGSRIEIAEKQIQVIQH